MAITTDGYSNVLHSLEVNKNVLKISEGCEIMYSSTKFLE